VQLNAPFWQYEALGLDAINHVTYWLLRNISSAGVSLFGWHNIIRVDREVASVAASATQQLRPGSWYSTAVGNYLYTVVIYQVEIP
jgi:predicted homoserine dehydrogenase-like protein